MLKKIAVLVAGTLFSVNVLASCNINSLATVYQLMAKRASYMQDVALYKYDSNENIYDANQELKVLQNNSQLANKLKLDNNSLLVFTQLQMDFSKQIEAYWIGQWNTKPDSKPNKEVDLNDLRQNIVNVDKKLYPVIKASLKEFARCDDATKNRIFKQEFSVIQGVPVNPDFVGLINYSLENIKPVKK